MSDQTFQNRLYEKDEKYMWHHLKPYQKEQKPMVIERANGAWITDIEGNSYLDGMSGLWCVNVGYGRDEMVEAATEQLYKMPFHPLMNSHVPGIQLSEKLNHWLKGNYRIFFSNSGSEANETAFKIARQYHHQNGEPGRYKFISRYRSYHGNTFGSLAATGQAQRKYRYEPLAPGFIHVHAPDEYRVPSGQTYEEWSLECAHMMEDTILWERPETVAGVIMEPMITGGGVLIPHPSYVKKVEEICKKYGILFINDEVICGFGRTGENFGYQHYGVEPDIVTMAKGITSGYLPLAATAVKQELYEPFKSEEESDHFRHVNTFGGHPAACNLAIKNLEIMEAEQLIDRSKKLGAKLREEIQPLEDHPNVGNIRQKGLLFGIELVKDKKTKEPASSEMVGEKVAQCKSKGLIISKNGDTVAGYSNTLTMAPPLSMTDDDATMIVRTLKEVFQE
ncbi:aspartate aminotransferase family protein [Salicibibacter kimchii]|uniref:Aspartate aminotransferase family protein n=1 Tax=Salicibibacter kimchii TaxID=2099786 RepID=A0A345C133_9BACI|nr:aspartate aminotransferase family protein [Salicibibacter kimchii]AXF56914.1 aspartate aminotransferase family protein [Salicibibacter kimchii]